MKRYKPYIFCGKQRNTNSFPCENVRIDHGHHQLNRLLRKGFFQLIHARFGTSGIRMLPLKEKWSVPLVTSFHGCDSPGTDRMRKHKKSLQRLFAIGECFTVPCQAMKRELMKHGCPEDKITVQYSGIDLDQFTYKERSFPEEGPLNIIYVGRMVEKKGAELLLKAFQRLQQTIPQARLTLVGEGALKNKLQKLSKKLRIDKHVEFKGALSHQEVVKQLERSHIFCLPSMEDRTGNQEGIPNAIKEAMACGLPVVSTFHSGIPELIEDGRTGHLVAEKDVNGLVRKLIDLIRQPETWSELGRNARAKIEADFNRNVQTEKLERLFDHVIQEHEKKESERPFFSVIIPTYNRERFIGKTIKSVLQQTCTDYEIIVVDDGSTDHTAKIINSFGSQVRYVYQKNSGPSVARNTGIRLAKGKYIAFLDSDDLFLPHKLEKNKKFLESNPNCQFLYSWYYEARRGKKKRLVSNIKKITNINEFRFHLYRRKFTIRTSTAVIHHSCFDTTGLFNSKYRYSQDWDIWLRLASRYRGYCQKTPLVVYRRHHRKEIPAAGRHPKIRKTAYDLYQWNKATLNSLDRKYGNHRTYGQQRKGMYNRP
ncbi:glycosyltransferase [Paenibacillus eucommiae]|uniref:Glycosyltransferase involved in cell wall biosynthesis n=1 Tax=Paenibacillus eucommiae TaxID=1355755 RepID=A0ABS4ITS3_9BACL|nr:glycosyltransferase [Paenibacillus eucommiae]MBP1990983.1 glycosyltransferase involved in cell wall biosynthesis [Paenibacillus eucommiae]